MIYVLDACALIAYLRNEDGAEVVDACLVDETATCYIHAVNLCEVYYDVIRVDGIEAANTMLMDIDASTITIYHTIELALLQRAGQYKTQHRLSLADCFALAFTVYHQGTLITSDRKEFGPVEQAGVSPIRFIR